MPDSGADLIATYFRVLDAAIEKLSNGQEGFVSGLPGWLLSQREIRVCVTPDGEGAALRVAPNESLESDQIEWIENASPEVVAATIVPWSFGQDIRTLGKSPLVIFGGLLLVQADNPIAPPSLEDNGIIGFGQLEGLVSSFSEEKAKEEAVNFWNAALLGDKAPGNFVHKTNQVFRKFAAIIKRKAFLERRIHRYVNEHARLLLPSHTKCYYEHKIHLGTKERRIDFVLEREVGMPAVLIELESPVHKIFKKNGEPTGETNHAKNQIAEWVSYIDMDAAANARGDFSFLSGPKQQLVVIGRGLENRERLINSKFSDTTLWTYDLMLEQARERWNTELENQYRLVGLPQVRPF
jgi:hypothetical protein